MSFSLFQAPQVVLQLGLNLRTMLNIEICLWFAPG